MLPGAVPKAVMPLLRTLPGATSKVAGPPRLPAWFHPVRGGARANSLYPGSGYAEEGSSGAADEDSFDRAAAAYLAGRKATAGGGGDGSGQTEDAWENETEKKEKRENEERKAKKEKRTKKEKKEKKKEKKAKKEKKEEKEELEGRHIRMPNPDQDRSDLAILVALGAATPVLRRQQMGSPGR